MFGWWPYSAKHAPPRVLKSFVYGVCGLVMLAVAVHWLSGGHPYKVVVHNVSDVPVENVQFYISPLYGDGVELRRIKRLEAGESDSVSHGIADPEIQMEFTQDGSDYDWSRSPLETPTIRELEQGGPGNVLSLEIRKNGRVRRVAGAE